MNMEYGTTTFTPKNKLEEILVSAQKGEAQILDFFKLLLASDLYIPSGTEVDEDGTGLAPLFFHRYDQPMMAVFTDISRVNPYTDKAKYCLKMNGRQILIRMPKGHGMVINPGFISGLEIQANSIQEILDHA